VGALLFIMAGTHRCANEAHSPCDGASDVCGDGVYHESDMGHVTESVYQAAHEVFTARCPQGHAISMHGTVRPYCEDVFLSNGHETDSKQVLYSLRDHMLAAGGITVGVAGDGHSSCPLYGSTNVQGRLTNGSPDPCLQEVLATTGFFIHAEQKPRVRDSLSVYCKLIAAIQAVIPEVCASVPAGESPRARERTAGLRLSLCSPNPCRGTASLKVEVCEAAWVTVEAYTPLGRRVAVLRAGIADPGSPAVVTFDARSLPGGLYFVRASTGREVLTRAVAVVK
jgi:hypothetical protein